MKRGDRPLTDQEKVLVRRWAAEGVSYREIGVRLRRTKNSIVGHVHRLELPARPSPIIRRTHRSDDDGTNRNGYPLAAGKSYLPHLPSLEGSQPAVEVRSKPMKWSESQDELLKELERQGLTWREVGKHFGVSGSSAKHRATRLKIPPRDGRNFIRRSTDNFGSFGPREVSEVRNTLPVLESQSPEPDSNDSAIRDIVNAFAVVRPVQREPETRAIDAPGCRYPLWGNGRPTHEFCNEKIYRGSWCTDHYHVVFYKQSTRDNAA